MTFGEMNIWTKRFNQIIGAAQILKNKRLTNLKKDIISAHEGREFDRYAGSMLVAVAEQIEAQPQKMDESQGEHIRRNFF